MEDTERNSAAMYVSFFFLGQRFMVINDERWANGKWGRNFDETGEHLCKYYILSDNEIDMQNSINKKK